MSRSQIIASDDTIDPVTDAEIDALRHAAWHARSKASSDALVSLLRKLSPDDETLRLMDRQARRLGYVHAGSDELLGGVTEVRR